MCLRDMINVETSLLLHRISPGAYFSTIEYFINSVRQNKLYWLCDFTYLKFFMSIASIFDSSWRKQKHILKRKEAFLKEFKRALAVFKSMWHILVTLGPLSTVHNKGRMMTCSIILYNTTVRERHFNDSKNCDNIIEIVEVSTAVRSCGIVCCKWAVLLMVVNQVSSLLAVTSNCSRSIRKIIA